MATMPLVAGEPWKWAEQYAKTENDLYKMFEQQAWQAEQNDLTRAQQNNMQQNTFGQQTAQQGRAQEFQRSMQNDRFDFNREMAEGAAGPPPKLVDKMRAKMTDLISMGIPQVVAAAMVGNAAKESGIDPRIQGDGGASFGEYQFNNRGEGPALQKFAQERGLDIYDPKTQRAFVWHQLQGPYRATLEKMIAAKDPAVAAEIFSREYERPNPQFADNKKRARYATQAYTLYGIRGNDAPATAEATSVPNKQAAPSTPASPPNSGTNTQGAAPSGERQPAAATAPKPASGTEVERVIGPDGKPRYRLKQG